MNSYFPTRPSLLLLPLIFLLMGCDRVSTNRVLAQVLEMTGQGFVIESSQSGSPRIAMRVGTLIRAGQTIETGENAAALISLLPGLFVQLQSNAVVGIDRLVLAKSGRTSSFLMDSRAAYVRLDRGSLWAITVETYVPTELQISTRAGTVTATQKAAFCLSASTEFVRLTNVETQLAFHSARDNATKTVNAGHFKVWTLGGTTISDPPPAEKNAEMSEQVETARNLEAKIATVVSKMAKTGVVALPP